jgi:ABC-type branched-subunit amino acid transport system permease subunit
MFPDLLNTLIALCLISFAVLDLDALTGHAGMVAIGAAAFIALGLWATRVDHLKWPGITALVAGIAILALVVSGLARTSSEWTFWVVFWSANAAGVVSLWSAMYRGPHESPPPSA